MLPQKDIHHPFTIKKLGILNFESPLIKHRAFSITACAPIITLALSPAGQLPVAVSEDVPHEAYGDDNEPPPPLPPKIEEDDVGMSLQTPKQKGSAPSRPPKSNRYSVCLYHSYTTLQF